MYAKSFGDDIDEITGRLRADSPAAALAFAREIAGVCAVVIKANPLAGHQQQEFGDLAYTFVARGRIVLYSFEPVFNLLHFHRLITGQNMLWRELED